MKTYKKAFTLVELVVVVAIVGILSTIGFVAYTSYLDTGRDTNRITQLDDIRKGLQQYSVRSKLPLPENPIDISASGSLFAYQGYLNETIMNLIGYTGGGKDSEFELYPTYMLGSNKKDFQLMTYISDRSYLSNIVSNTHAAIDDYSELFPKFAGQPLGILINSTTNVPLQEITAIKAAGDYDIISGIETLKAYYSDSDFISSSSGSLSGMISNTSCKRIKQMGKSTGNNIYTINPLGTGSIRVYCDMETEGGGWTLVHKTTDNPNNLTGALNVNEGNPQWKGDGEYKLSIDYWKGLSTEAVMAKNIRIDGLVWEDIVEGIIEDIGINSVYFSATDTYKIFDRGTVGGNGTADRDGTHYWYDSGCRRCVNYTNVSAFGAQKQPMLYHSDTSTSESPIEGAGGTSDDDWHILSKMGIFIR